MHTGITYYRVLGTYSQSICKITGSCIHGRQILTVFVTLTTGLPPVDNSCQPCIFSNILYGTGTFIKGITIVYIYPNFPSMDINTEQQHTDPGIILARYKTFKDRFGLRQINEQRTPPQHRATNLQDILVKET